MPVVPSSFIPTAQDSGRSFNGFITPHSPSIEFAGLQSPAQQDTGGLAKSMADAGVKITSIADMAERYARELQDRENNAVIKDAEAELLDAINDSLYGEDGYIHKRNRDALGGKTTANDRISSAIESVNKKISNDEQRKMWDPVLRSHIRHANSRINSHYVDQLNRYEQSTSENRVKVLSREAVASYGDEHRFSSVTSEAENELAKSASFLGFTVNSPQFEESKYKLKESIATGVIDKFNAAGDWGRAEQAASKFFKDGWINEEQSNKVSEHIRKARESEEDYSIAYRLANSGMVQNKASAAGYVSPVIGKPITSSFGKRMFNGEEQHHNGVDFATEVGTTVSSMYDGKVVDVNTDKNSPGGIHVKVQHTDGTVATYMHLSSVNFDVGAVVKAGDPIALSGNTGTRTTGPHLHVELRKGDTPVNPLEYGISGVSPGENTGKRPESYKETLERLASAGISGKRAHKIASMSASLRNEQERIDNEAYNESVLYPALMHMARTGGDLNSMPRELSRMLKPADRLTVEKQSIAVRESQITETSKNEQKFKSAAFSLMFAENPSAVSQADVTAALNRGDLDIETWKRLMSLKQKDDKAHPSKMLSMALFNASLVEAGLSNIAFPMGSRRYKEQKAMLFSMATEYIDAYNKENPNPDEKDAQKKLVEFLSQKIESGHTGLLGWFFGDKDTLPVTGEREKGLTEGVTSDGIKFSYTGKLPDPAEVTFMDASDKASILKYMPVVTRARIAAALERKGVPATPERIIEIYLHSVKKG